MKKIILPAIAIFLAFGVMDFFIHGKWLSSTYEETASLWRPMEEMKMGLGYGISLLFSLILVQFYRTTVSETTLKSGMCFGFYLGLLWGLSMGFGTYTYMPIPLSLAISWFVATLVETTIVGGIMGLLTNKE